MRDLASATWPSLPDGATVFVPVGSTEQHGPHLPLSTDTVIATAVARALADDENGYVTPAIAFGASGEHQGFPGVGSIGTDALHLVLVELVRSLSLWAGRIVLVNGHGGNVPAVALAVDQLRGEGHAVSWIPCTWKGDAHAGYAETSLMLHLAPWDVRLGAAESGNTTPIADLMPMLVAQGVRSVSPNGVLGDPTLASGFEGARLLEEMISRARSSL